MTTDPALPKVPPAARFESTAVGQTWNTRRGWRLMQSLGPQLTPDLLDRLSAERLAQNAHKVVLVVTTGKDGFPHPAMLSYFEVVALDAHNIRLATYSDSRTTNNMRRTGQSSLVIVDVGCALYVKGFATELRSKMIHAPHSALINFRIASVHTDAADAVREGETHIVTGITYNGPSIEAKIAHAGPLFAEMLS